MTNRITEAADHIREHGIPQQATPLLADLIEAHAHLHIEPACDDNPWPRGWIAVDLAQRRFAEAVLDT